MSSVTIHPNKACPVCYTTMSVVGTSMNGEYRFCSHCHRTDFVPYPTQHTSYAMDATEGPANKVDLEAIMALVANHLDKKDQQRLYEALYAWGCRIGR